MSSSQGTIQASATTAAADSTSRHQMTDLPCPRLECRFAVRFSHVPSARSESHRTDVCTKTCGICSAHKRMKKKPSTGDGVFVITSLPFGAADAACASTQSSKMLLARKTANRATDVGIAPVA